MPKKFAGENSKAVAAKERKNAAASAKKDAQDKAKEDAFWEDNDKHNAKKQSRKEDVEKKRLEALAKKKEREDMLAMEEKSNVGKVKAAPQKVTQAMIRQEAERREEAARRAAGGSGKVEPETHLTAPLQENINRLETEGEEARSVTEAIQVLSLGPTAGSPAVDKHPEKRMKAAYEDFEKVRLPELKAEYNNLRLSQLKQMLKKEWQKHPDNPLIKQLAGRI